MLSKWDSHIPQQGSYVDIDDNCTRWFLNGKLHREDGPAWVHICGNQGWYINGECHRVGGPAIITDEYQDWYQNGMLHNDQGPASVYQDGSVSWYLNNYYYTFETWSAAVEIDPERKLFLTLKYGHRPAA